jgi:hypothetical protein
MELLQLKCPVCKSSDIHSHSPVALCCDPFFPQDPPHLLRLDGHIDVGHPQVGQGIDHRVDNSGRRRDGGRLPHALGTQRVMGTWGHHPVQGEPRQHGRRGQGVVHQTTGEQLATVVPNRLLQERRPDPLGQATVDLPIHDRPVQVN